MIGQDSPAHPPKNKNAKIPDGGGPGFESSQQQQETGFVTPNWHRHRRRMLARSLARLHAQQNATQRRILQQEQ
jgi:hypothetical protein